MSPSSPAWTVIGLLLAVAAVTLLIRRFRQGDPASRWLAVTAAAWGAAFAVQGIGAGAVTAAVQLTLSDLLAMLGLPALAVALLRLARRGRRDAHARLDDELSRAISSGQLTDGYLLALSIFTSAGSL